MPLDNPVGGVVFSAPGTTVWDGSSASPSAYADLDLSAVVGDAEALVLLEVYRTGLDCGQLLVRRNGETMGALAENAFCNRDISDVNYLMHVMLMTDSAGIIEWFTVVAQTGVIIKVRAFIRGAL